MHWLNEPKQWSLNGPDLETGVLEIITDENTDFWRVTHYGFSPDNGHAYLKTVAGNFIARVEFTGDYTELYDQAGLMLRLDGENWIKTGIELEQGQYCMSAVVTRTYSDWNIVALQEKPARVGLKLERSGDAVRIDYSLNGLHFQMLRLAYFPADVPVQIGVMACSPKRMGFKAQFRGFSLEHI
ncbi:MAG: DUF1349 domain-containing protein [Pseudopedobacter sp.]|nr:DUF1349 domain-containing protein [Deinococcales bacterium]